MNAYLIALGLVLGFFYGGALSKLGMFGILINSVSIILVMGNQLDAEHIQTWIILGCVIGNRMEVSSLSIISTAFAWIRWLIQNCVYRLSQKRQKFPQGKPLTDTQNDSRDQADSFWNDLKK